MVGHHRVAGVVTVVILAGLGDLAEGAETSSATIVVELSNQAGVAAGTLTVAKSHVSRIYADIGVEVVWTDAPAAPADGRFVVHLMIRTRPPRPRMMGHAFGDARDTGGTAFVYRDRVLEVGRARNIDLATLLAFTMAHEMGHLLLPAPSHAVAGIMRADWGGQEFRDIADHSLRFTSAQGQAIHGKASASRSVN